MWLTVRLARLRHPSTTNGQHGACVDALSAHIRASGEMFSNGTLIFGLLITNGHEVTKARAATLHLPHGPVPLPIFMPVATQASLKGLTPDQLEDTGCRLCLNNTYHLSVLSLYSAFAGSDFGERS